MIASTVQEKGIFIRWERQLGAVATCWGLGKKFPPQPCCILTDFVQAITLYPASVFSSVKWMVMVRIKRENKGKKALDIQEILH